MQLHIKECQQCKNSFHMRPEDTAFYEKINVPAPTFCPECRRVRRMVWRNERTLYKRSCDLCHKPIISVYRPDGPYTVYCRECWWSDTWDASTYGRPYDFSRPFFEQFKALLRAVPHLALWQRNAANSDFSNMVAESKNVYLSCSVVGCENVFYSKSIDKSFNICDSTNVTESDNCYENIECEKNYNSQHLTLCRTCIDCAFLIDCTGCRNCILSSNLRNKEFYIRNKPYSKDDYVKEVQKLNLASRAGRKIVISEFEDMKKKALYKFANTLRCTHSTGNNLFNAKNCHHCFNTYDIENSAYCYRGFSFKDNMDFDFGIASELMYEYTTGALNDYNVRFSYSALNSVRNADYTFACMTSTNLFGCVGLKNKQNAIFNTTYSPEEFAKLRERIITHMNEMPFPDAGGRIFRYGEFFPVELSPFAYNETIAQEMYPLTKEKAYDVGYPWQDITPKSYTSVVAASDIADDITKTTESILGSILGCSHKSDCNHQCLAAFRLTRDELEFYRKNTIPIPNLCSNCRYYERLSHMPPLKLFSRQCACDYIVYKNSVSHPHHPHGACPNVFETPYAPERPEIVYCEPCYHAEVA